MLYQLDSSRFWLSGAENSAVTDESIFDVETSEKSFLRVSTQLCPRATKTAPQNGVKLGKLRLFHLWWHGI